MLLFQIEHYRADKDNTALNALNLICANHNGEPIPNHRGIQSGVGHRGLWTSSAICPKINGNILFLQEFKQYIQKAVSVTANFSFSYLKNNITKLLKNKNKSTPSFRSIIRRIRTEYTPVKMYVCHTNCNR